MAVEQYTNNAATTLDGAIDNSTTTVVVVSATGFPASAQYRVIVDSEIMLVTAGAGTTSWTVTRGAEGTTAASHSNGAAVTHVLTAGAVDQIRTDNAYANTYANRLTAAKDGRLFLPSNGFYLERDTGSVWAPWGPLYPLTAPVSGDFAWINQGGASVTTTNGGIHLNAPASASGNMRIRKKSAPGTPYSITAMVSFAAYPSNYWHAGLCFRQSSDGKLATLGVGFSSNAKVFVQKYTDPSTTSADYVTFDWKDMAIGGPFFLRIEDDSASRICSYSTDGVNFKVLHSVGNTDFLTADEVGFYADSINASHAVGLTLYSWKQA